MKEIFLDQKKTAPIFPFDPLYLDLAQQLQIVDKKNRFIFAVEYLFKNLTQKALDQKNKILEEKIIQSANKIVWQVDFLESKEIIKNSLSKKEKIKLYEGMLLTRLVDNKLKHMFLTGEIVHNEKPFSGKGFRSLGQEAIYGAMLKLNCGKKFHTKNGYEGDVAGPMIRDLGVFLAMSEHDVETALNAQAAKSGKPMEGKDLHLGDFSKGIITAAAPLAISTCTLLGLALSFKLKKEKRIALSFIGEGGSSLGEWHEAINMAAAKDLPMIFCIENNQQALSTPVSSQSKLRSFADKGIGYGLPSVSIDGNDPEEIAASFAVLSDLAREKNTPSLIELVTMRMCGHAHHDDMLYLGAEPKIQLEIPKLAKGGYANEIIYEKWLKKDPIFTYEKKLFKEELLNDKQALVLKKNLNEMVQEAFLKVQKRSWPKVLSDVVKNPIIFSKSSKKSNYQFNSKGKNYLQAIEMAIKEIFVKHKNSLMIGEDVAPPYGNAFMMFKNIMNDFKDRFINTPISENAIVGSLVGLCMNGYRPIGEMQFNDFVACAMNQVANNAAKSYFRLGINLPMVLRMPYGGLRRAGPFHSQDTSAWFYKTAGLKIMAPSTPLDAYNLLQMAADDDDPVLFYEHIALYREPSIKQDIFSLNNNDLTCANLIKEGKDITIISYGAYVHMAYKAALMIEKIYNKSIEVIDLRFLKPIDFATCFASIKKTSRVLLCGEDSKTGSLLQFVASVINEEMFCYLDAPIKVLGSKDTPVPYAPSLEDEFLLSTEQIIEQTMDVINF